MLIPSAYSGGGLSLASKLRTLSSEAFVDLLTAIFRIVQVIYASILEILIIQSIIGSYSYMSTFVKPLAEFFVLIHLPYRGIGTFSPSEAVRLLIKM